MSAACEPARFQIKIANLLVSVTVESDAALIPGSAYVPFVADEDGRPADLRLEFSSGRGRPWFERGERVFKASRIWELHSSAGNPGHVLRWAPEGTLDPRIECLFDVPYALARVRMEPWPGELSLSGLPVVQMAFETRLARLSGGFLVHALGLDLAGRGVLLPGSSGRGKSTLSLEFSDAEVLSDERVACVSPQGGHELHGTPWRGTAGRMRAAKVPLSAVVFLGPHEGPWGLTPLGTAEVFRRLVFHAFPPFWDRPGLNACLDLAQRVAESVPAFELRFQRGHPVRPVLEDALAR